MASRKFSFAIAIFLGLTFIFVTVCIAYSFHVRSQAESCLEAISKLHVGSSTQEEAHRTMQRWIEPGVVTYTGEPLAIGPGPHPCDCLVFENSGFYLLGVFHSAELYVHLVYENGVLAEKSVGYQQDEPRAYMGTVEAIPGFRGWPRLDPNVPARIEDEGRLRNGRVLVTHPVPGSNSGPAGFRYAPAGGTYVLLSPNASDELRRAVFAFNLACFTTVRGCGNPEEILRSSKELPIK